MALQALGPIAGRGHRYLYPVARCAGEAAWMARPAARRRMTRNLLPACGGDRAGARAAGREAFRHVAEYWLDLVSIPYRSWDRFARSEVAIEGSEWLAALEAPGPVILASCHSGNPEMAIRALAEHGRRDFIALVEPLQPPALSRHVLGLRNAGPGTFVEANVAGARLALRTLRAGGAVGLVVDRHLGGSAICAAVLGRRVRLPRGPWELALRTHAVVVPAFAERRSSERFVVHIHEPFSVRECDEPEVAIREAVKRWAALFGEHLRRFPDQWTVLEDYWRVHACAES